MTDWVELLKVGEVTLNGNYGFNDNGKFVTSSGSIVNVSSTDFPRDLLGFIGQEEVTLTKYDEPFLTSATYFGGL